MVPAVMTDDEKLRVKICRFPVVPVTPAMGSVVDDWQTWPPSLLGMTEMFLPPRWFDVRVPAIEGFSDEGDDC